MWEIGGAIVGVQGTLTMGGGVGEESGGGCGGGRGGMMVDTGVASDGGSVNFGPGQGAPSLQYKLT
jgi:hypothetical protein